MKVFDLWLPTWIILAPLLGVLILLWVPKKYTLAHRVIGILATVPSLCFAIRLYLNFDLKEQGWQWLKSIFWFEIPVGIDRAWSVYYQQGVDGLSLPLVLLTCVISTLAAMASIYIKKKTKGYYLLFLLLETSILGVFLSTNLFLFFIFFELTLIFTYFLIGIWGYIRRERAANYFLIYNGLGSGFLLLAVVGVFVICGTLEFPLVQKELAQLTTEPPRLLWVIFIAFLLAFAIKLPVFPFHSWMLRVHVEAHPAIVMIHSGILLKMGAYGFLRFGIGWFPQMMKEVSLILIILGLISLFYGAILAFVQKELKRVLAYSSISHMGILLLGIASLQTIGLTGALFQAISHGLISALLFFLVGSLYERTRTTELQELGGIAKSMPIFSGLLMVGGLALLGLPGFSGFISEFFSFLGLFEQKPMLAGIGSIGLIFAAGYTLRAVLKITFGSTQKRNLQRSDLRSFEWFPMFICVLLIIAIGIYPDWLGDPMKQTIQTIALRIGG